MKKVSLVFIVFLLWWTPTYGQEDLAGLLSAAGGADDFKGSSYLTVFTHTKVKVMDSGLSLVNEEVFHKVLTPDGARRLKAITFDYDPQSAYVEIKAAKIVKKCGKIIELSPTDVKDYPAPARAIYWGARQKLLPVGRLEPGDGIWIKLYRKGFTYALLYQDDDNRYVPPMKGHFYDIVEFYSRVPINRKTYEVSVPADKKLQFEFYNGEARHYAHTDNGRILYLWEKKDILPYKRESDMVAPSDVFPKLLLSTSPDWQAKSVWFYKVNEDYGSFEFDNEIKRKVDEIVKGARNDWEKVSRLTHWVAEEIRYSGISMGEGEGYTLHKGTMTFLDRCGVCKDKAGMLVTMLRAAGFTSYAAMTMAGSRIDRIPADQFNHSVTVLKLDGKYHLLDPTWVPGVRELWSSAEQQQEYLMGLPEGADLNTTPLSPPENHYLRYYIDSRIDSDGKLTASIRIETEGQSDARFRRGIGQSLLNQQKLILEWEFFQMIPGARISGLDYLDPVDLSRPFKISFTVEADDYLKKGKDADYLTPLSSVLPFSRNIFFSYVRTGLEKRKYPFRTRCSQHVEVHETVRLPGKYKVANLPEFKKVTGSGADFSGSIQHQGNRLTLRKTITMKKRIYPVEDWQSFRESVMEFQKPEGDILILSKGGGK